MIRKFSVHARLEESECRAVDLLAARRKVGISELVRALIREEAARAGLPALGALEALPEGGPTRLAQSEI